MHLGVHLDSPFHWAVWIVAWTAVAIALVAVVVTVLREGLAGPDVCKLRLILFVSLFTEFCVYSGAVLHWWRWWRGLGGAEASPTPPGLRQLLPPDVDLARLIHETQSVFRPGEAVVLGTIAFMLPLLVTFWMQRIGHSSAYFLSLVQARLDVEGPSPVASLLKQRMNEVRRQSGQLKDLNDAAMPVFYFASGTTVLLILAYICVVLWSPMGILLYKVGPILTATALWALAMTVTMFVAVLYFAHPAAKQVQSEFAFEKRMADILDRR